MNATGRILRSRVVHRWPSTSVHRRSNLRRRQRQQPRQWMSSSSTTGSAGQNSTVGEKPLQIWEYRASDDLDHQQRHGVLYVESAHDKSKWEKIHAPLMDNAMNEVDKTMSSPQQSPIMKTLSKSVLEYFLPAHYPKSVAPGYERFASLCFTASIAGSAAMVLSTQTLLLAVGVVGSNAHHAGIMAGAFNWVMKDFVGQLGGVLFASQMGKTRAFDADPKRWRMVAAMALDGATLLEILSPLFPAVMVLPVASVANVGKNIGFLTASASRASLHQSLAITGNLGDVTAKSGSQSIMASLIGTSLGIGMSSLLAHDTYNFAMGFCVLGLVHQGCNYLSLQFVPLSYFNRQRLHILLDQYIEDGSVMSPVEVAKKESYFPLVASDTATKGWLSIGAKSLDELFASPSDLREALAHSANQHNPHYLVLATPDGHVHLMFSQTCTAEDMLCGVYHACLLRRNLLMWTSAESSAAIQPVSERQCDTLLEKIRAQGWRIETEVTTLEHSHARRFAWK